MGNEVCCPECHHPIRFSDNEAGRCEKIIGPSDSASLCGHLCVYPNDRPVSPWRSIETAPKDGREVLLFVERRAGITGGMLVGHWMPGGYCIEDHPAIDEGWYFWSGSMFDRASKPLFWMPLPEPPKTATPPQ